MKKDTEELQKLLSAATRANVKLFLSTKIQESEKKLKDLEGIAAVESTAKEADEPFFKPIKSYCNTLFGGLLF